jgi:hypothetical protein
MLEIEPVQRSAVSALCRFTMTADAYLSHEFCAFELPGCEGCPNAVHFQKTVRCSEGDPMKSKVWSGWIAGASRAQKLEFLAVREDHSMERYIHRENLALFKRRLMEQCTDAQRGTLMKLLADEEAKKPPPQTASSSRVDRSYES